MANPIKYLIGEGINKLRETINPEDQQYVLARNITYKLLTPRNQVEEILHEGLTIAIYDLIRR